MAKLDVFLVTDHREVKHPQHKLPEPEGRVFASAVKQALDRSKTVYSQEEACSRTLQQKPVKKHQVLPFIDPSNLKN
jgi:hypothetical protein